MIKNTFTTATIKHYCFCCGETISPGEVLIINNTGGDGLFYKKGHEPREPQENSDAKRADLFDIRSCD